MIIAAAIAAIIAGIVGYVLSARREHPDATDVCGRIGL